MGIYLDNDVVQRFINRKLLVNIGMFAALSYPQDVVPNKYLIGSLKHHYYLTVVILFVRVDLLPRK